MVEVLANYNINVNNCIIKPLGNGLINTTWKIVTETEKFVLQKINIAVFKNPANIAFNIDLIGNYLQKHYPNYIFTQPIKTNNNNSFCLVDGEYYRMFQFIENSKTINVVSTVEQAFEAAYQFGLFTKNLIGVDVDALKITIPNFHNLSLRYQQFEQALQNGNKERISEAKELIDFLLQQKKIVAQFEELKPNLKSRVTHHDTKISNILFDENFKGLAVIDLDTVMPGYFISDVGDMIRTYACPVSEEENDFETIIVRKDFLTAIENGYLKAMGEELSAKEKESFLFAGKYMVYMQALRFLTDYLQNDVYYGCKYPTHNLVRAGNQATLLQKLFLNT